MPVLASQTQRLAQLSELIDRQIEAMRTLHACLQAERRALETRNAEELSQAAAGKSERLTVIATLEQQRVGLVPDAQAMALACGSEPELGGRWQELLELTASCRDLNEANGTLIRWQRRRVEGTLRLLRGASGPAIYGPDGGNQTGARVRTPLASA
jgi:flagella synthesis protein FlgN